MTEVGSLCFSSHSPGSSSSFKPRSVWRFVQILSSLTRTRSVCSNESMGPRPSGVQNLTPLLLKGSTHTPSIAFRHLPPGRKDVVDQCLEFGLAAVLGRYVESPAPHLPLVHQHTSRGTFAFTCRVSFLVAHRETLAHQQAGN